MEVGGIYISNFRLPVYYGPLMYVMKDNSASILGKITVLDITAL